MIRYFKPARDKHCMRGFFSYVKESVANIYNAEKNNPNKEIKVYNDLTDIPGYGKNNVFDICFTQDYSDYKKNPKDYSNIEYEEWRISKRNYDYNEFNNEEKISCERIIKDYFILNQEMLNKINERHSQIDFSKTIGFHRRATDMESVHNFKTLEMRNIFTKLEEEEFENIFVMSDNIDDLMIMKKRYGNKLITYDEFSTSKSVFMPFFKTPSDDDSVNNHIKEIVFGSLTLGKTKKLICTLSNLTGFSILSNSKLNYDILKN